MVAVTQTKGKPTEFNYGKLLFTLL